MAIIDDPLNENQSTDSSTTYDHYHAINPTKHVGVLNSASGKTPGGKLFRGTISQEDCICRASLLYPCLMQYANNRPHHFYHVNNKPKYVESNTSSACAIFSPHVPIIRKDTVQGELLDHYKLCSFVSIPATNAFVLGKCHSDNTSSDVRVPKAERPGTNTNHRTGNFDSISLEEAVYDRLYRALCIFAKNGVTDLVLCAFGCGMHGNNPRTVANIFRQILLDDTSPLKGRFDLVVFAIQPSRTASYDAFTDVFPEASTS